MEQSLDSIKNIKVYQSLKGYRFTIDSVILAHFINVRKLYKKAIEFGAGCGVISILLSKMLSNTDITAVEIQENLFNLAKKNVELNQCQDSINVLNKDINCLSELFAPNTFDLAFSNPPFRKIQTGFISPYEEKSIARHEILIDLKSIIQTASYLLNNRGLFYIIYHPFRLVELIVLLRQYQLEPKTIRFVHNQHGEDAVMVLLEAIKGAGAWLKVEKPLYIRHNNEYTEEVKGFIRC
jgi:tRNA1Val (adenine37-N6)-methyltransferase